MTLSLTVRTAPGLTDSLSNAWIPIVIPLTSFLSALQLGGACSGWKPISLED